MNEANTAAATPGDLERAAQDKMIVAPEVRSSR